MCINTCSELFKLRHEPNVYFQVLGLVVFGLGIWVLVDKPSFLNLFEEVRLHLYFLKEVSLIHFRLKMHPVYPRTCLTSTSTPLLHTSSWWYPSWLFSSHSLVAVELPRKTSACWAPTSLSSWQCSS